MTFQLRRMVLVNAGTNTGRASRRVTEIDPRGGASVTGSNGVGKTSTLRLIPLFFGHPTSQVVALDDGQEGVRFILPNATSAICFEYQRGSDAPEDLRLAVMRAQNNADAPEYRIFPCGYMRELFIQDGRFVTDEVTSDVALALGFPPTTKLSTPEYRTVILGGRTTTANKNKIHAYARQHSFGPRELPNLDRLVATMVKDSVKFEDLVQVAVGLVLSERGGEQGQRLTFRQQRTQLEAWLRNRDAAERALAQSTKITDLTGRVAGAGTQQREWRNLHHEVLMLIGARKNDRATSEQLLDDLNTQRQEAAAAEDVWLEELRERAASASEKATDAAGVHEDELARQRHFDDGDAPGWAEKILRRSAPLAAERAALDDRLRAATASVASAQSEYLDRQRADDVRVAAKVERELAAKDSLQDVYRAEKEKIEEAERTARADAEKVTAAQRSELDDQLAPLQETIGALRTAAANPARPADLVAALASARQRQTNHAREAQRISHRLQVALTRNNEAQAAYGEAERKAHGMKLRIEITSKALELAQKRLAPAEGTLLSALRRHGDDGWKKNLAKVVNPELIDLPGLAPLSPSDSEQDTFYGWQLDTSALAAPDWTDDAALRAAVAAAHDDLAAAQHQQERAQVEMRQAYAERVAASAALDEQRAEESVGIAQADALREATETEEHRLDVAERDAKATAERDLAEVSRRVDALKAHRKELVGVLDRENARIRKEHQLLQDAALQHLNEALAAIERSVNKLRADASERRADLKQQLDGHLRSQGVSPELLDELRTSLGEVNAELLELENKRPLVDSWDAWKRAGGPLRVTTLAGDVKAAKERADEAVAALRTQQTAIHEATERHANQVSTRKVEIAQLQTEISTLTALPALFGEARPTPHPVVDLRQKAADVRRKVERESLAIRTATSAIDALVTELVREFTAHDSTTRQLFEGHLHEVAPDVFARAGALTAAYRRMGTQVVHELNNTLHTVLANIGAFHKSILDFESDVSAFNRNLQEALQDVKRFKRVDDLQLHIVPDFESLAFYKKLKNIQALVKQHRAQVGVDLNTEMPTVQTAEGLRDFLSVMGRDGALEVNLGSHISLHGSVVENGKTKQFRRASELEGVSSTGLTALILITLLVGLVNTVRRGEEVHVPWITDEVGHFDPENFAALLRMLAENRIDVVTASPSLDAEQYKHFANSYSFHDGGVIKRPVVEVTA